MNKQTVIHPDNGILFYAKRKGSIKPLERHGGNLNAHH